MTWKLNRPEPEQPKELDGKAVTGGSWAAVDVSTLADDAAIRAAAQQLKAQGADYGLVTLKDADGSIHYASQVAAASGSIAGTTVDPARIAAIFREEGIIPAAQLAAFTDPVSGYTDRSMAVHYSGTQLWLDNVSAKAGGKSWLDPSAASAVQYVGDLIDELHGMGFEQVVLTGVQFPNIITRKQEFAAAGGKSQEGRAALLAADISTWQARFDGSVVLWLSYPAQQCTDASDAQPDRHGGYAGRGGTRTAAAVCCRSRCAERCDLQHRELPVKRTWIALVIVKGRDLL